VLHFQDSISNPMNGANRSGSVRERRLNASRALRRRRVVLITTVGLSCKNSPARNHSASGIVELRPGECPEPDGVREAS